MQTNLAVRSAAGIGLLVGALSAIAGVRVLAGSDPGYVVLTWLVEYNVAAGVVGVVAGMGGPARGDAGRAARRGH